MNRADMQHDDEKTEYHRKSSAKNTQSKGQQFKSWVFYRAQWALNSSAQGLIVISMVWYTESHGSNIL